MFNYHIMKTDLDKIITCHVEIFEKGKAFALIGIGVWDDPIDDYGGTVFYEVPYDRLDEIMNLAEDWCTKQESILSTRKDHYNEDFYPDFEGIEKIFDF